MRARTSWPSSASARTRGARITGSIITDEKVLGTAHVAFGDNASGSYGGDNRAAIHVDGVMADATIEADGVVVMRTGVLV